MDKTIGLTVEVLFNGFNKTSQGKVDTGATISSLHATDIKINGNRVEFSSPISPDRVIKMELEHVQDVASADGGNNERPVVLFDVTINGVQLNAQRFNLNDRSNMDVPILIGQNIIEAGEFLVDITQEDSSPEENTKLDEEKVLSLSELVEELRGKNIIVELSEGRQQKIPFDDIYKHLLNTILIQ